MADAKTLATTIILENNGYTFKATGSVLTFDGYLKVYSEYEDSEDVILPDLKNYKSGCITADDITKTQHFTKPAPRYTESSLIKEMESLGIGRPSTYATIVGTIKDRGYVILKDKKFEPTEIGIEKYVSESQRKITSLGLSKSSAKLIKANSILLTSRATIGAISINKIDCTTNQGFQSLIPNGINLNYLYYLISTKKFQNKLFIHSSKSTFLEISHKEISKLKINVPINKHEQEKIGLFFDLIDNKIQVIKSKN